MELRNLAMEKNICAISALQTNRSAYDASDFGLSSISESLAIAQNADSVFAIIRDEDLDEQNELWIKILKNRYSEVKNKKFNIGADVTLQSFFDTEQAQDSDFTLDKIENNEKKHDFSNFKF
jgi:replicative DNA helicase